MRALQLWPWLLVGTWGLLLGCTDQLGLRPSTAPPPPPLFQLPSTPLSEYAYPSTEPRIPHLVQQWAYNQSGTWGVPLRYLCDNGTRICNLAIRYLGDRFWRAEDLTAGLWAQGLAQFRPLLAKLSRGEPITVVAFGSSVTSDFGGCNAGPERVKPRVQHLPLVYAHERCKDGWYTENGWLANFMQLVNATWPHPDHLVVNAARPGQNLAVTLRSCAEDEVPSDVDMYILENVDAVTPHVAMEQALWQVLRGRASRHAPRPAVVIINSDSAITSADSTTAKCMTHDWDCHLCSDDSQHPMYNYTQCDGHNFLQWHDPSPVATLAHYYGVSLFSMRQFYANFVHDEYPSGWPICWMLTRTFMDGMHPSPLGRLLFADVLVNLLRLAEQHAIDYPAARVPGLPQRPLYGPAGRDLRLTRCLMVDDDQFEKGLGHLEKLDIVRNAGWNFTEHYVNPTTGQTKYKPGWVAEKVGAALDIQLDTTWPEKLAQANSTMISITFLSSYEHMGIAFFSCVLNCQCAPMAINAHREVTDGSGRKVSLQEQVALPVTQHERCVVRLEVHEQTLSGEHRFKLVNLMVTAKPVSVGSQELRYAAFRGYGADGGGGGAVEGGGGGGGGDGLAQALA